MLSCAKRWLVILILLLGTILVGGCLSGDSDDDDESESESSPTGVYTIGGYNEDRATWWRDVWKYNGSWVYKTSASDYVCKYASVVSGATIYVS